MLKKNLKIMTLVVAVTLLTGSLTACQKAPATDNQASAGSPNNTSISKYEPQKDKKYKFTWTFYQTAPIAKDPIMKKYWEDKFNVEFDIWDIDQSKRDEILNLKMASGNIPDVYIAANPVAMEKYVKQDVAGEIPFDVLKKYAPNVYNYYEKEAPGALQFGTVDGKLYGLPEYTENPLAKNPVVWRGDWLKNVGIAKVPDTLQEFETAIYKFTNEDPDKNGKQDTYGLSKTALSVVFGAFGYIPPRFIADTKDANWNVRDGKMVYAAVQPEMKDALKLMQKWYKDKVIDPEFITGENQGGYWGLSHAFINGRIGVSSHGQLYHWQPKFYEDGKPGQNIEEMAKINPKAVDEIQIGNPPVGPTGKRGSWANPTIKPARHMISKAFDKEPDKLGKLLQIFEYVYASPENYTIAQNGVQGPNWNYAEKKALNGKIYRVTDFVGDFKDAKNRNANFAHTALTIFSPKVKPENAGPDAEWGLKVEGDKYRNTNELFVALASEGKYKAELDKIVDEAYINIITGAKPVEYFDEFVANWRKAGGEVLEKEANDWYKSVKK